MGGSWEMLAHELADARGRDLPVIPPSQRFAGFGLADAYEVGLLLTERRAAEGHRPAGVKIGLTNSAVWPRIGITHPVWAHLYEDSITASDEFRITGLTSPRLEVEVVVKLSAALPVGASVEQVAESIEGVALGFEIVDCHYPDWKFAPADLVADHGLHVALLVGPTRVLSASQLGELAELRVTLRRDAQEAAQGNGRDVLGGPLASVATLLTAPFGRDFAAGEHVSTGALTGGAHPISPGQTWAAETSLFPRLEVRFR